MAIMGSGAVGVEFASIFSRFGSDVTILELLPRLVPVEDEAVSAELEKSFRKQGITRSHRREGHRARTSAADGVDIEAQLADGSDADSCSADYLLVATGRGPVTTGLNAEGVGLQMENGYIRVDAAVSDQRAGHFGDRRRDHARAARASAAGARVVGGGHRRRRTHRRAGDASDQLRPRARLHLLRSGDRQRRPDRDARRRSAATTCASARFPFGVLGRAKMAGETEGFVKIVADKKYDELLGVHMIGSRVDRARRRGDRRAAPRSDGRGADSDDSPASDDGRGDRRSGARGRTARRSISDGDAHARAAARDVLLRAAHARSRGAREHPPQAGKSHRRRLPQPRAGRRIGRDGLRPRENRRAVAAHPQSGCVADDGRPAARDVPPVHGEGHERGAGPRSQQSLRAYSTGRPRRANPHRPGEPARRHGRGHGGHRSRGEAAPEGRSSGWCTSATAARAPACSTKR